MKSQREWTENNCWFKKNTNRWLEISKEKMKSKLTSSKITMRRGYMLWNKSLLSIEYLQKNSWILGAQTTHFWILTVDMWTRIKGSIPHYRMLHLPPFLGVLILCKWIDLQNLMIRIGYHQLGEQTEGVAATNELWFKMMKLTLKRP